MLLASLDWSGSKMPRPSRHDLVETNHSSDTFWGRWGSNRNKLEAPCLDVFVSCVCGCCVVSRVSVGVDFQEELSDMLLLRMLQAATRASADKDRVRLDRRGHSSGFIRALPAAQLPTCRRSSPTPCGRSGTCFTSCGRARWAAPPSSSPWKRPSTRSSRRWSPTPPWRSGGTPATPWATLSGTLRCRSVGVESSEWRQSQLEKKTGTLSDSSH